MSLAGSAVVAIWNDVAEAGRANFYEWHNREHIPERVAIDGFLRGRRYITEDGAPEYSTLYEVRDDSVLGGPGYLSRLNAPTPWTTRSVSYFRNVARSLCRIDLSHGAASGGVLGTVRFDCPATQDDGLMQRLAAVLAELAAAPAIVAHHVCRADIAVSTAKTAEQEGRPDNAVPRWVVLIEGSTTEAVRAALAGALAPDAFASFQVTDFASGTYTLQFDLLSG